MRYRPWLVSQKIVGHLFILPEYRYQLINLLVIGQIAILVDRTSSNCDDMAHLLKDYSIKFVGCWYELNSDDDVHMEDDTEMSEALMTILEPW